MFGFFNSFTQENLRKFILNKPEEIFLKLGKIFYINLHYKDGVITSEVRLAEISLSIREITFICDELTMNLYTFEAPNTVEDFYFLSYSQSLLIDHQQFKIPSYYGTCDS